MPLPINLAIHSVLNQLDSVILSLTAEEYTKKMEILSGASIGQHARHIIDMFICLENGYSAGMIDYDHRERNQNIENHPNVAQKALHKALSGLDYPEKPLQLKHHNPSGYQEISSTYSRELLYCLEHSIHHMALVKVGLISLRKPTIPDNLGVAYSTQEYRQSVETTH